MQAHVGAIYKIGNFVYILINLEYISFRIVNQTRSFYFDPDTIFFTMLSYFIQSNNF